MYQPGWLLMRVAALVPWNEQLRTVKFVIQLLHSEPIDAPCPAECGRVS